MDDLDLFTPKMIEDRAEVQQGDMLFLHTGWHRFGQFGKTPTRSATSIAIPGPSRHGAVAARKGIHIWGVD